MSPSAEYTTIEVRGIPVAQGRPRFARVNGFVRAYDPAKSREWKEAVKLQAIEQVVAPLEGAIRVEAYFRFRRPKSLSKKVCFHTRKPDCTNLVKGVEDALRGIAYQDDAQIISISVNKRYCLTGEAPGVTVHIRKAEDVERAKDPAAAR